MENKLQKLLKKFKKKNFDWNELSQVMDYLKGILNNCRNLSNDEIETLLSFQDENGEFSLAEESFKFHLPLEGKLDLIYFPSYYMTLILVKYSNQTNSSKYKTEIEVFTL